MTYMPRNETHIKSFGGKVGRYSSFSFEVVRSDENAKQDKPWINKCFDIFPDNF